MLTFLTVLFFIGLYITVGVLVSSWIKCYVYKNSYHNNGWNDDSSGPISFHLIATVPLWPLSLPITLVIVFCKNLLPMIDKLGENWPKYIESAKKAVLSKF